MSRCTPLRPVLAAAGWAEWWDEEERCIVGEVEWLSLRCLSQNAKAGFFFAAAVSSGSSMAGVKRDATACQTKAQRCIAWTL
jgi:hypothetical protein